MSLTGVLLYTDTGLHARWLSPWAGTPLKVWDSFLLRLRDPSLPKAVRHFIILFQEILGKWLIACWINTNGTHVVNSIRYKLLSKSETKTGSMCTQPPMGVKKVREHILNPMICWEGLPYPFASLVFVQIIIAQF